MIDFDRFEILTFDCYGTLIDWESGILDALRPLLDRHDVTIADDQLLQLYAGAEAGIQSGPYQPYAVILRQVAARLAELLEFHPSHDDLNVLVDSVKHWPPFADSVTALQALKKRFKLGIISNIDDDLFEGSNRLLQVEFDHIITAAQVKAYKPDETVFNCALGKIGLPIDKILHVAQSIYHDHAPAKKLGLTTIWINRRHKKGADSFGATPPAEATPDLTLPDLASLASIVEEF